MKKNLNYFGLFKPNSNWHKLLLTMKISAFLLFCCLANIFADATYSQSTKISLNLKDATIEEVLNKIEGVSEFYFLYNTKLIDVTRKVDIIADNEPIKDILNDILSKDVKCIVYDRQIILTPSDVTGLPEDMQQRKITGTVLGKDGNPLAGVNVVVTGKTVGTITDIDGKYIIDLPQEAKSITFSFIGMEPQEINIGTLTQINVSLVESAIGLNEVVVIGYGTVKKSDLTGSVSSVKATQLSAVPTTNVVQALSGQAAGVQVKQNSGAPGADISVRIRGTNSIQGSNEPLYVIDGFPISESSPTLINNLDIESIEVLKDASATAIYGSRGANGVVIITTKSGKSGQTKVDIESSFGIQTLRKKLDFCNAKEYAEMYNEVAANDGQAPFFTQAEVDAFGKGFDWQNFVFRQALEQNQVITVSGGNEKTQFSISGSMFNQDGIIKNSYSDRYSFRINLNHEISKKFSVSTSTILTKIKEQYQNSGEDTRGGSLISAALGAFPTLTPYNDDGSYRNLASSYSWGTEIVNPIYFINEEISTGISDKVLSNAALTYKPISNLSIRVLGGIENADNRSDFYQTLKFLNSHGNASVGTTQSTSLLNENTATYNNTIGKNSITAMAGFTYQNFLNTSLGGSGSGFLSDATQTYNLAAASSPGIATSSYSLSTLLSYIGRLNYSYNNKYLATVTFRSDGSSKYSEGNKWGYFPSAALAWRISNEKFLKEVHFLSVLKLRASWGVTGSQAINAYATLNQLTSDKTVFGDALYTTFAPGFLLPGNLKWETTKQTDVGFDAGFFDNRINFTADYYIKNTTDLLNSVLLPSSLGYTSTIENVGAIRNSGFEFEIGANILSGSELTWNVDGNIAFNRNIVEKLYAGKDIQGAYYNLNTMNDYVNILRVGQPFGAFYGYTFNGYDKTGNLQYLDRNGDGIINESDKSIIGNPNPKFIYGLNSTLSYKNFNLIIFIQGTYGNQIMNLSEPGFTLDYGFGLNTLVAAYEDHWTPDNTNAEFPSPSNNENVKVSNRFVEDGSYLRLKNIELAYNLPCKKWGINIIRNAQIYASAQNLLTLTKYSWWDPDVNSGGGANSITQGIDYLTYPTSKSVSFGIRIGF